MSSPSSIVDDDDSLTEIFSWLPLKSLFRFKSVCKAWHCLISADDGRLRRRLSLVASAVFCRPDKPWVHACTSAGGGRLRASCDLGSLLPFDRNLTILDCSNGLLLCRCSSPSPLVVVDPITGSWARLPEPASRSGRGGQLSILAFDPAHSPHFKVVRFAGWLELGAVVEVFESETGTWAEFEVHWGVSSDAVSTAMRYIDGVLYALAYPNYLVGVDLAGAGEYRKIELPGPVGPAGRIGKLNGMICYAHRYGGDRIKIWVLGDDDGAQERTTWALRHVVGVRAVASAAGCGATREERFEVVAFDPAREVAFFWATGRVVGYDLRGKAVAEVFEVEEEDMEGAVLVQLSVFPFSGDTSECLKKLEG